MAVLTDSQRVILPVAPIVGAVTGAFAATMFALVPTSVLEAVVLDSGVASLVAAAAPPLGFTARLLLVLIGGGGLGVIAWFATFLVLGNRAAALGAGNFLLEHAPYAEEPAPVLRRADAHPDAPARRPLRAQRDLGTPLLLIDTAPRHLDAAMLAAQDPTPPLPHAPSIAPVAERPLPDDLDQPLSAYASTPLSMPHAQILAPGERFETFALKRPKPDPSEAIHALLDRLEQAVQRQPIERMTPTQDGIDDMLESLRAMARRAH